MPLTHEDLDQLLTYPQVAELLHVSLNTVKRMVGDGQLDVVRIGSGRGLPRVPRRSVVNMINVRMTKAIRPARRAG